MIGHPSEEPTNHLYGEWTLNHIGRDLTSEEIKIQEEKKKYIESQIGKVTPDLIFQQMVHSPFSEDEIYLLHEQYDDLEYHSPYGRQVMEIVKYVEAKKEIVGKSFPRITMVDVDSLTYDLPSVGHGKYLLLHFWTSFCSNCRQKNRYFSDFNPTFQRNNIIVVSVCIDYYAENWLKVLDEEQFVTPHFYHSREEFMDLADQYKLELSTTLLMDDSFRIISRDKYKLDDLIYDIQVE